MSLKGRPSLLDEFEFILDFPGASCAQWVNSLQSNIVLNYGFEYQKGLKLFL